MWKAHTGDFRRVAILGLGLMGGSPALARRDSGMAEQIAGYDRTAATVERASERGMIDQVCLTAAEAVKGAGLVVLAVPVLAERTCWTRRFPRWRRAPSSPTWVAHGEPSRAAQVSYCQIPAVSSGATR